MKCLGTPTGAVRQRRPSPAFLVVGLTLVAVLISAGAVPAASLVSKVEPPIASDCKADLAKRLDIPPKDIRVVEAEPAAWPDAALGLPEMDKSYAQVQTPGFGIILEAKGARYLYTAGSKTFRYGGPTYAWFCSMLYLKPRANDANLNGDLYQCSLLGTNSVRIASEVSDFYPQSRGIVMFTRRTSRSGFDLLCVKSDGKSKPKLLDSAFAFGAAAIDDAQDKWAAIVRTGLGSGWQIVIAGVKKSGEKRILEIPQDTKPERIAWSGEDLMIMAAKGTQNSCFRISLKSEKPEWEKADTMNFPGVTDFVLNKSQSLGIEQIEANGKPAVEVATVWFTGNRDSIARIEGLTMRGCDLLLGLYAFVWGEQRSRPAAYAVDIRTGEVLAVTQGISRDVKPYIWPPRSAPEILKKLE